MTSNCVQCGKELEERGLAVLEGHRDQGEYKAFGNAAVYVCTRPDCPNYGLLQTGITNKE